MSQCTIVENVLVINLFDPDTDKSSNCALSPHALIFARSIMFIISLFFIDLVVSVFKTRFFFFPLVLPS